MQQQSQTARTETRHGTNACDPGGVTAVFIVILYPAFFPPWQQVHSSYIIVQVAKTASFVAISLSQKSNRCRDGACGFGISGAQFSLRV
jgi:hypothetical protein